MGRLVELTGLIRRRSLERKVRSASRHSIANITNCTAMGLFKPDFFRSLALGFAAGAVLVFGALDISGAGDVAGELVPSASAAATQ